MPIHVLALMTSHDLLVYQFLKPWKVSLKHSWTCWLSFGSMTDTAELGIVSISCYLSFYTFYAFVVQFFFLHCWLVRANHCIYLIYLSWLSGLCLLTLNSLYDTILVFLWWLYKSSRFWFSGVSLVTPSIYSVANSNLTNWIAINDNV